MARDRHFGRAGEMAVMSEFLLAGYNVATPEVDVGSDVYVIQDKAGDLWRLQVKTATGKRRGDSWVGRFQIPLKQLMELRNPPLYYALALRKGVGSWEFALLPQDDLRGQHESDKIGWVSEGQLELELAFRPGELTCTGQSLEAFRNRFVLRSSGWIT